MPPNADNTIQGAKMSTILFEKTAYNTVEYICESYRVINAWNIPSAHCITTNKKTNTGYYILWSQATIYSNYEQETHTISYITPIYT